MSEELHVDEYGYVTGYTDDRGNIYDINHQLVGHTDGKGTIYDRNFNVVGHYGNHGYIYNQNYQTVGHKEGGGAFYNEHHQRSSFVDLFDEPARKTSSSRSTSNPLSVESGRTTGRYRERYLPTRFVPPLIAGVYLLFFSAALVHGASRPLFILATLIALTVFVVTLLRALFPKDN